MGFNWHIVSAKLPSDHHKRRSWYKTTRVAIGKGERSMWPMILSEVLGIGLVEALGLGRAATTRWKGLRKQLIAPP